MKILITTSTLPASDDDPVPAFVKDQAIAFKEASPELEVVLHAPHNNYSNTSSRQSNAYYRELRYHYFIPRYELLAGRAILPALRSNKLLYLLIPFFCVGHLFSLYKVTRSEQPDLIYAHWFMPQAISAAIVGKLTSTPFVFTTHAADVAVITKFPLMNHLVRWVCKRAKAFTAVSERTAQKLRKPLGSQWSSLSHKFSIIPMGVTLPTVQPQNLLKTVRKQFDIPANKNFVLFIGRLAQKKGVTYLLKAFAKLEERQRQATHLIIAGDGQLLESLKAETERLSLHNVTFTGYASGTTKDALLQLSDYVCLPSIIDSRGDAEGFPVVLMEALAFGKIVLASNVSGGEQILTDGIDGYVFPQKSTAPLTSALTRALSLSKSQRTIMEEQSRKKATQYSWDVIAKSYLNFFEVAQ